MGRLIAITAAKVNGQVFAKPRVVYVNDDLIMVEPPNKASALTKVIERTLNGDKNTYEVYEKATQIEIARNPASTDLYLKKFISSALAGAGTTQGAGTVIPPLSYFNEALTIGAAATEAFVLPSATVAKVVVVINNDAANDQAKVFPASGQFINDQAVNTVFSILGGERKHFVCLVAGKWRVADDFGI